jgi:hypothetical protein
LPDQASSNTFLDLDASVGFTSVPSPVVIVGIHTPNLKPLPARTINDLQSSIHSQAFSGALSLKWFIHLAYLKRAWVPDMSFDDFDDHSRNCKPFDDRD